MKNNKYVGIAMMAVGMLAATSCSDYADYNDVPVDSQPAGNMTLWENISQNPQLTDFAALVKKTGFDTELSNTRSYTVWAPLNGTYTATDYQLMDSTELLNKFVKTHVAEFNHHAIGDVKERIYMLNSKAFNFIGNGTYVFGDNTVSIPNQPSSNGLLHIMNGEAKFLPNIYEYLSDHKDVDSIGRYVMRYEETTLDEKASVKGPMVNGVQTYVDSVKVTSNKMTGRSFMNAKLEAEDSLYTFIKPTNDAYNDYMSRVKPYYKFAPKTIAYNLDQFTSAESTSSKTITVNENYMCDSLVKRSLIRDLIFSQSNGYNKCLTGDGESSASDSICSTNGRVYSNPSEILSKEVGKVRVSNGEIRLVDSLAFLPWESYCPELMIDFRTNVKKYFACDPQYNNVQDDSCVVFGKESGITKFSYLTLKPNSDLSLPDFFVTLPNVQSTKYRFYCVFMPMARNISDPDSLPNALNFTLNYSDESGHLKKYNFSKIVAESLAKGDAPSSLDENPSYLDMSTCFKNDQHKTDTLFLGEFTFPVSYRGLTDSSIVPSIRVTSPIMVFDDDEMARHSRSVSIWAILMKPVELDEFEKK